VTDQLRRNESRFYTYPMRRMVAILDDDAAVDAAVSELKKVGLAADQINLLTGSDGVQLLDRKGSRHGLLGRLLSLDPPSRWAGR